MDETPPSTPSPPQPQKPRSPWEIRIIDDLLNILIVPLTIALVGGIATYVVSERQRLSAERQANAMLAAQYIEIYLGAFRDLEDTPASRSFLMTVAQMMEPIDRERSEALLALTRAVLPVASEERGVEPEGSDGAAAGFRSQPSYAASCDPPPSGSSCARFADGYIWLVPDRIVGWREESGRDLQIAIGLHAQYYHVLRTDRVKVEGNSSLGGR